MYVSMMHVRFLGRETQNLRWFESVGNAIAGEEQTSYVEVAKVLRGVNWACIKGGGWQEPSDTNW